MSNLRQGQAEPAVRGYAVTHPPGSAEVRIESGWDQLLYTASGVLTARTDSGLWIIPPDRALWIPSGERVVLVNRRSVAVRALYFPATDRLLPPRPRAFAVTRFGRELLLHAVRDAPLDMGRPVHRALRVLLVDQIQRWSSEPLGLPVPRDPRARAFVDVLQGSRDAANGHDSTDAIARSVGTSTRTLERIFHRETGTGVGAWRRRAAILTSLDTLLATGSVTDAAMVAGYGTPSAYITAFRRELDATPGAYLRATWH